MTDLIKAAKLWAKVSAKTGGTYYVGRMGGCRVLVLENRDRQSEDEPTHWLMLGDAEAKSANFAGSDPGGRVSTSAPPAKHDARQRSESLTQRAPALHQGQGDGRRGPFRLPSRERRQAGSCGRRRGLPRGQPGGHRPMKDRGWAARRPDETPVGELLLRNHTIDALRAGDILTLGELRAMGDRELLGLRGIGRAALVGVRCLVPAPAGSRVAIAGDEVTIAGRAFALGAVYAPRPGSRGHKPRRLLRYVADSLLSGGRVTVAVLPSGKERVMAGTEWVAWAGEPVDDDLADVGRTR